MLASLTKENWQKFIGEKFRLYSDGLELELDLQEVSGYGRNKPGNREAYSLQFCGPLKPVMPQKIYRIENAELGGLELFLVPIGPKAQGMIYEAIFT